MLNRANTPNAEDENMFREMRRKDKALAEPEIVSTLEETMYGVLGTMGDNGYPCTVPLNYVFMNNKLYFHSATTGEKIDNLLRDPKVSFCVTTDVELLPEQFDTNYKSVVVFGRAAEVFEMEKEAVLISFIEKYSKAFMEKGHQYVKSSQQSTRVFGIAIDHVSGKFQR